jgi:hypothetical protein
MRIDRLAQENPRTQGPRRRDWYRRHSPLHLDSVAALVGDVLSARAASGPARAVVLGAGACTELPLQQLTQQSEFVTLVDLDVPGIASARVALPASLRPRVELMKADLSGGVSAALRDTLQAQPWEDLAQLGGPQGAAPLDAAAACLEQISVPNPPTIPGLPPHGYDLVISDLVLTQLFSLPLLDLLDTLSLRAPVVADLREAHPRYRDAARHFRRRVALAHLALLGSLLATDGAGLLLTDVTGHLLPPGSGPHAGEGAEMLPVLPPDALALPDDMAARFAVMGAPRSWLWLVTKPDAMHPGRAYDVTGLVFRPKTLSCLADS